MIRIVLLIVLFSILTSKSFSRSLPIYPNNLYLICKCEDCVDTKKHKIGIIFKGDYVEKYETFFNKKKFSYSYDINDYNETLKFLFLSDFQKYELLFGKDSVVIEMDKMSLIKKNPKQLNFKCQKSYKFTFFIKFKKIDKDYKKSLLSKKVYSD